MKFTDFGVNPTGRINTQRDIFEPLFWTGIKDKLITGIKLTKKEQLTLNEMMRIPEIYASFPYGNFNFDESAYYTTPNNKAILGGDIKAMLEVIYSYSRSAYSSIKQIEEKPACAGVPLGLKGLISFTSAKNYNTFRDKILSEYNYKNVFTLDMYLGFALASIGIDWSDGKNKEKTSWGLITALHYTSEKYQQPELLRPKPEELDYIHRSSSYKLSLYRAPMLPESATKICREEFVAFYNSLSVPLRLMLTRRWVWANPTSDMICDIWDWDYRPVIEVPLESLPEKRSDIFDNMWNGVNGVSANDYN